MKAEMLISIYQKTAGMDSSVQSTYYALIGAISRGQSAYYALSGVADSGNIQEVGSAEDSPAGLDKLDVILQPLKLNQSSESGTQVDATEDSLKYIADGHAILVQAEVFYGAHQAGLPCYEYVGSLDDPDLYKEVNSYFLTDTFQASVAYIPNRMEILMTMLHVLGWYRDRVTRRVYRYVGLGTYGKEAMVVLQDPKLGSLDPVLVRPVQGIEPVTEDGARDIWNGLQILPLEVFTAIYWLNSKESITRYEYLGQDYREEQANGD